MMNSATSRYLENHEDFLDATLSVLPCLVSYIDEQGIYRYVNRCYEEWFGTPAASVIGRHITEVLGPSAMKVLGPYIEGALRGEAQGFETEVPYQTAGLRHVKISYIPARPSPAEDPRGFYAVVQDISEQVLARKAVQEHQQELRKIIDNLPAVIAYWDAGRRNVHANRAFVDDLGKDPDLIKGWHVAEVAGAEMYEEVRKYIDGVYNGEPQQFEQEFKMPDGTIRHGIATLIPDFEAGPRSRVQGYFSIINDVTPLKLLERERLEMERRLVSASKLSSLGEMAAGIAHEINNPLTIIQGYASQLRFFAESGTLELAGAIHGLGKIEATVDRIAAIVRGLRAFARDAEADPVIRAPLSRIVSETIELCVPRLKESSIRLETKVDTDVSLLCRPAQITQILVNLLNNSADAVSDLPREKRWIRIEADPRTNGDGAEAHPRVRLRVTDAGGGIAPEVVEKMMLPFFTTKEVGKGTGLGLSISRGLAEVHGGTLIYDSARSNTSFVLELPCSR